MANIIIMQAPSGVVGIVQGNRSGQTYTIDSSGFITVDPLDVLALLGAGFLSASVGTVRSNLTATTDPGATNDSTQDYAIGSRWVNKTAGREWVCIDATATAAVWMLVSGTNANLPEVNTNISTVGAGTLTAAALVGGLITRSGSTAAYTDTTDTAALIIAAMATKTVGMSWEVAIKNTVPFPQTIAAGTGVTLAGQTIIPANSVGRFLMTYTGAGAITMRGISVGPLTTAALLSSTALTTVGAGTITGAGIAGGITNRTGSTAAYTDTTDTAANIIAGRPNANIGDSWVYTYYNNTLGVGTLTGGTGVTVTNGLVPPCCWSEFLVTYTAAATITMVAIAMGPNVALPNQQYVTAAGQSTTLTGAQVAGANICNYDNTGTTPGNLQMPTAANLVAAIPNCQIGFTYMLRIRNSSGSANTATITTNTGITLTGTMTIAQTVTREFAITVTSLTAVTVQSMGISAAGA